MAKLVKVVKCVSFNPRFPDCCKCVHRLPHKATAECGSKVTCVIATSRMLKGWCKAYMPPKIKEPKIVRQFAAPKL